MHYMIRASFWFCNYFLWLPCKWKVNFHDGRWYFHLAVHQPLFIQSNLFFITSLQKGEHFKMELWAYEMKNNSSYKNKGCHILKGTVSTWVEVFYRYRRFSQWPVFYTQVHRKKRHICHKANPAHCIQILKLYTASILFFFF